MRGGHRFTFVTTDLDVLEITCLDKKIDLKRLQRGLSKCIVKAWKPMSVEELKKKGFDKIMAREVQ